MTESAKSNSSDVPMESSIPKGTASLESILCTEELQSRPSRPPNYEKENYALRALVSALADSPRTIFQTLADTILDITQGDSAGLSLLTRDGKTPDGCGNRFYWPAIAGMWNPHVGGGTPRNFGPCEDVLDCNRTLLFRHFERRYPYLVPVSPAADECLLVPFYVGGQAVGTIWSIMHSDRHKFDKEDNRVMASLGKFASSAYQALKHIEEDLKIQVAEREKAEAVVRAEIGIALARKDSLRGILDLCAKAMVRHLDAAFVRIWTLNRDGRVLELQASAGLYTRLDGSYSRIPFGKLKIGCIAQERKPHLTNDVQDDPRVADHDWARAENITSFAGYPLMVEDQIVGVMAMFSRNALSQEALNALTFISDGIAQCIERKHAEERLRRSEALLAEGQRLGQIGSFSWRVATDEIRWSEQLYRIYEIEIGVPVTLELIRTRVHPEDISLIEKMKMVHQARSGDHFEWHYRLIMPDHSIKHLHAVAHASRDQDGQLEYIAAIQDVTARRRSEEALDKGRSQLAHMARVTSLGVLTASIAHEVNQPLSGIVTNASTCLRMLGSDSPNVDGARETARRTIRDANRASEVITRLRALYAKKESMIESVDLTEATREVVALSLNELQRKRVILRLELADGLPLVAGDRVQLQQVILNLLRNASDAMSGVEDRPRELVIRTERDEGDQVRLSVKDVGVGLESQAAEKLFEAFYTTKSDGMGIGLSVSRSIIQAHEGRLWATPNDGPGATFSFAIPFRPKGLTDTESRVNQTKTTTHVA
jgi:signal transduction histidine kinase